MNGIFKNILSVIIKSTSLAATYITPGYTLFVQVSEIIADTFLAFIPTTSKLSQKKLANYIFETIKEVSNIIPGDVLELSLSKEQIRSFDYNELKDYIVNLSFDFDDNKEENLIFTFRFTQLLLEKAERDQTCLNYLVNIYISNLEKEIVKLLSRHKELKKDIESIKSYIYQEADNASVRIISKYSARPKSTYVERLEIRQLKSEIEKNNNYIVVRGIGGVGKTELCKKVFWDYFNDKDSNTIKYLAWIQYTVDLKTSLLQAFPKFSRSEKTIEECIDNICEYLNSLGKELVLFVDNISKTLVDDRSLSIIRKLSCRIVITTRIDIFDEKETLRIGGMEDRESKKLFEKNFRQEIPANENVYFDKLVELCAGHTLTIELLAKIARQLNGEIEQLYNHLVNTQFKIPMLNNKISFEEYENTLIEHLKKVFNMVKLNGHSRNILIRLAAIPSHSYTKSELLNWKITDDSESLIILNTFGWINIEYDGSLSIHPIIAQVVLSTVKITYKKFQRTIESIAAQLEMDQSTNYYQLYKAAIVGEHLSNILNFENEMFAVFLNNVAAVLCKAEERERAIILYDRTIAIKIKIGVGEASLSSTYNNISLALKGIDHVKSLFYAQKSLEIERDLFEKQPEVQAEHCAITLNNFGLSNMNLSQVGEHDQYYINAEKAFWEALEIRQKYDLNVHGQSQIQNNMGLMYSKAGDLYKGLLMHIIAASDNSSPNIAIHKYNLGKAILYIHDKKYLRNSFNLIKEMGVVNLEQSLDHFRNNEGMNKSQIMRVIEQLKRSYSILGDLKGLEMIEDLLIQLQR